MFGSSGILRIAVDVICLILVGVPFVLLNIQQPPNPFKRGFFCNDDSIRYPLKNDTISYQLLGGVMIPFALIVMTCGEFLWLYLSRTKPFWRTYLLCLYKAVGSYLFGAAANQSLTDITKYSIGRLRPHFLAVCKPAWEHIDCNAGGYIENFNCTGDKDLVSEARLSFFSGHSSFSMYCMLFLALYIQARMKSRWLRLLCPTFQFFMITTAVYVGLTRVSDYKHHWSDVLTGLLQGGSAALFTVFCVSRFFGQPVEPVVLQAEVSHSLQDNPSTGNHYGSTE